MKQVIWVNQEDILINDCSLKLVEKSMGKFLIA